MFEVFVLLVLMSISLTEVAVCKNILVCLAKYHNYLMFACVFPTRN